MNLTLDVRELAWKYSGRAIQDEITRRLDNGSKPNDPDIRKLSAAFKRAEQR